MRRMLLWTLLGGGVGFVGFGVLFFAVTGDPGPQRLVFVVFALLAAMPVAIMAAMMALRDAIAEIRRDLEHLQRRRFDDSPSEHYQPKRLERGPG